MTRHLPIFILFVLALFSGCEREIEEPLDLGYDFQPLEVGLFWIYEVDQTIYFGENDSEQDYFFYQDRIRSFYINAEGEQVFIVERSKSKNNMDWNILQEYTLIQRDLSLVRTIENQAVVTLVFPPKEGAIWDGNIYIDDVEDEFELSVSGDSARIDQENSDDEVTYRDIRYEVYDRSVGLVEKYEEVLTYCSRNDCLGDMLIDSGYKIQMKLIENGKS